VRKQRHKLALCALVFLAATHIHAANNSSNNGLMWRAETPLADFPHGWNAPKVVLRDDIFEASHTDRLQGLNEYLTGSKHRRRAGGAITKRISPTATANSCAPATTKNWKYSPAI